MYVYRVGEIKLYRLCHFTFCHSLGIMNSKLFHICFTCQGYIVCTRIGFTNLFCASFSHPVIIVVDSSGYHFTIMSPFCRLFELTS